MKTSTRIIGIVGAVVLGLALFAGGFVLGRVSLGTFGYGFDGIRGGNFGFGMMNGLGYTGFVPMILTILFWVVVIGVGFWLISSLVSRSSNPAPANLPAADSALDILKKRYARGEITKEQYDQMSHDVAS